MRLRSGPHKSARAFKIVQLLVLTLWIRQMKRRYQEVYKEEPPWLKTRRKYIPVGSAGVPLRLTVFTQSALFLSASVVSARCGLTRLATGDLYRMQI